PGGGSLDMTWREQLHTDGFALLPSALTAAAVASALAGWDRVARAHADGGVLLASGTGPAYGARNLLELWPEVVEMVRREPLRGSLLEVLGPNAGVVRVLYFDKPPGHSWALPWHKDYSLAVREHHNSARFTKPTVKAGVPHVIAPKEILDRMLTVRVHLDAMTPENGPLRVIPGSHRFYTQENDDPRPAVTLHGAAGDVLLMRPLVTHASGHSTSSELHRRIVHLECTADRELTDGLQWKWFIPIAPHGGTS
ncbi:MAG: phytanoyl-CoA dioxygenase family protein, partial [Gemmataceae bacterium]|nr:phytanoyl-CoA dioxygenase family protein [Gemmataceae bacterium]